MKGIRNLLVPVALAIPLSGYAMEIGAKSAVVMDAATGKVLWARDADVPRYPASTTKIMTGLLLLEHTLPTDVITAPADVTKVKEASMHLKPFEKVRSKDMLYALMLRSANDGCYAVACHISGSVPKFSKLMNERAKQIGCKNTHFNNPNGLNDPLHTTSAYDLALIAREAMRLEPFREVVRTKKKQIARSINAKDTVMVSRNKWLRKDPTADGIKTGYTRPAGYCYVGSATRDGYRVITVVMNSPNWQKDHQQMLDWTFKNFTRTPLVAKDQTVETPPVKGGVKEYVALAPVSDVDTLVARAKVSEAGSTQRVELSQSLQAPIRKGQVLGTLFIRDVDGFEQKVPVAATEDIEQATLLPTSLIQRGNIVLLGGAVALGTVIMTGRNRRNRRARYRGRQTARSRSF